LYGKTAHVRIKVKLRRVRVTVVAVEIKHYYIFWVRVCSLSYPSYNAPAPYCHLWTVWLYCVFFLNFISQTKRFLEKKKVI